MSSEKDSAKTKLESGQEVDRIRDIIFGSQIKDYEQRFQHAQRDLDRLHQEIDRLSEQLIDQSSDQSKKLKDIRGEMRKADSELRDELRETAKTFTNDKVDRSVLGELFIELGNHLKTGGSLADLLKGLDGKSE